MLGQVDAVGFLDDAPPKADGVGLVGDEIEAARERPPFALEHTPGVLGGGVELVRIDIAGPAFGTEVGDFVLCEGAHEPEVAAGGGEDAVLAVGVPADDAVLEFGRSVESDFLGALDNPIFEDVVASPGGAALDGRRVGTAALIGAWHDAGVGAERVQGGEVPGIAEFTGDAGGEHETDAGNAGEQGVGCGGQGVRGFAAKFQGVALEAAVKLGGGSEGALQGDDTMGCGRQGFTGEGDDFGSGFIGVVDAMTTQEIGQGNRSAAGDLGGAEALLHEGEGGLGEGSQSAFGVVEKSGAELVRESVNAVGGRGLLTHEATTTAVEFAQVLIDGVRTIRLSGEAGATGEQGLGDAEQVQGVGARDEIFAVLFGFVCADTDDEIIVFAKCGGEVGDIRGFVLAAEKDLVLGL